MDSKLIPFACLRKSQIFSGVEVSKQVVKPIGLIPSIESSASPAAQTAKTQLYPDRLLFHLWYRPYGK